MITNDGESSDDLKGFKLDDLHDIASTVITYGDI